MTRLRKVDPEVLEREYVYDSATPPVSLTELAERHGLARSGVAQKALRGRWYERREEFRKQLGEKAVEKLGEQWVRFETALREKQMSIGMTYLEQYAEKLAAKEIPITTRDALGVMAMLRTYTMDASAAKTNGEEVALYDPETADLHPDVARRILALAEGDPGPDEAAAAPGAAESGPD